MTIPNRKPYPPSCPRRTYRSHVPASLWVPTNLPADQASVSGLVHCWDFPPAPPGSLLIMSRTRTAWWRSGIWSKNSLARSVTHMKMRRRRRRRKKNGQRAGVVMSQILFNFRFGLLLGQFLGWSPSGHQCSTIIQKRWACNWCKRWKKRRAL